MSTGMFGLNDVQQTRQPTCQFSSTRHYACIFYHKYHQTVCNTHITSNTGEVIFRSACMLAGVVKLRVALQNGAKFIKTLIY